MNERLELFRRSFPFCVREEALVRRLLIDDGHPAIEERDAAGRLTGLSVIQENNILLLCVNEAHRDKGIGSRLLAKSEEWIAERGFTEVTIGAGRDYLMPGVPVNRAVIDETLENDCVHEALDHKAMEFFKKRGYVHSWGCNCFDMQLRLVDFAAKPKPGGDIVYR